MPTLFPTSAHEQRQLTGFALVALAAAVAAWALERNGAGALFAPYLGAFDPVLALIVASLAGALSLRALQHWGWFAARRSGGFTGVGIAAACATLLAAPVIIFDALVGIDVTNAPAPWSLLFYPAIALLVEAVFHLAPLALVFAGLRSAARIGADRAALACISLVSILEPAYQASSDQTIYALEAYVSAQVWAVNLAQLYLFRRFGFASMLMLRLVYYLWWHIVWGCLR
ncbi:MAG: hypothetical protein ABL883_06110 [Terricaulis sp.]